MAEFLARRVYEGKLGFEDIPERFKKAVSEILQSKYGFTLTDTPMHEDITAEKDVVRDDTKNNETLSTTANPISETANLYGAELSTDENKDGESL